MRPSRREVLTAATFTIVPACVVHRGPIIPPSERLNIAVVGVGGRGTVSLENLRGHNIVALCDVDWRLPNTKWPRAIQVASDYPKARRYHDYRKMLDEMDKNIEAVVVATPDHTHAVIAMAAIKRHKHVYCEKPLAHSINEIRALSIASMQYKVAAQLGNQGHASEDTRRIVEWLRDDVIGTVREVHLVHIEGLGSTRESKLARLNSTSAVPQGVNWDLWLGPAPFRPFSDMYLPQEWRDWLAFGTGRLGDYTCHLLDAVAWALNLDAPETIEATTDPGYNSQSNTETYPNAATVLYKFPSRGSRPALTVTWHVDKRLPQLPGLGADASLPTSGGVVIGTKGALIFERMYRSLPNRAVPGMARLYPDELAKGSKLPPQTIPRVRSHWADWVECCKNGNQPGSNFTRGGMLSEVGALGNIAIRRAGKVLSWNAGQCAFTNDDEANALVCREYRDGWSL